MSAGRKVQKASLRGGALIGLATAIDDPTNQVSAIVPDGVEGACHIIDVAIMAGCASDLFDCPPVIRHDKGLVDDGRASYTLWHADGSATVVEVADDRGNEFVLDGLLRLLSIATATAEAIEPKSVSCVLACNCPGLGNVRRALACRALGVLFVPLGSNEEHRNARPIR